MNTTRKLLVPYACLIALYVLDDRHVSFTPPGPVEVDSPTWLIQPSRLTQILNFQLMACPEQLLVNLILVM